MARSSMKRCPILWSSALIALCALAGCDRAPASAQCSSEPGAAAAPAGPTAGMSPAARQPIAMLDGEPIYADEVRGGVGMQLYRLEADIHSLLKGEAEEIVGERLLQREAARRGVSVDDLLRAEVDGKAQPAGDADVDAYLQEHPREAAMGEAARPRIAAYLSERRRIERRLALMDDLRAQARYQLLLAPPEPPRVRVDVEGAPARGEASAQVTLVHFASFTSPASARIAAEIRALSAAHPGRIREVHRHFIDIYDELALEAAEVAVAAQDAGRFWELHDRLRAEPGPLTRDRLAAAARDVGLGPEALQADRREAAYLARVKQHLDAARKAGVERPPAVFVNGRFYSGTFAIDELRKLVDEELARAAPVN